MESKTLWACLVGRVARTDQPPRGSATAGTPTASRRWWVGMVTTPTRAAAAEPRRRCAADRPVADVSDKKHWAGAANTDPVAYSAPRSAQGEHHV